MHEESLEELGKSLLRRELEIAGDSRLGYRDRLPLFVRAAKHAGLPMVEVARTAGLSRKAVYDVMARRVDDPDDRVWGLQTALIGLLTARAPMSAQMADSVLRVGERQVWQELERLVGDGLARRLVGQSGTSPVTYYSLDEEAVARVIASRLEDIRGVRADSYSVYFALAPSEVGPVAAAAQGLVSQNESTIIRLGNNTAATTDELAVAVRAPDRRVAFEIAQELWAELARRAGIERGARVTQIIDPRQRLGETAA